MPRKLVKLIRGLKPFDRRQHPRYEPNFFLECFCACDTPGRHIEFAAEVIDISKTGLKMMASNNKILPKTKVNLIFKLPPKKEGIKICGQIVRTYRVYDERWYYSAVRFDDNQEEMIRNILDLILANQKTAS